MNPIAKYFQDISDNDLKSAILDIIGSESNDPGIVSKIVNQHARNISKLTNNSAGTLDTNIAQITLMKEASIRWVLSLERDNITTQHQQY